MSQSPAPLSDDTTTLSYFKDRLKTFNDIRGWNKHHTPANLAMSISIEAAELLEKFQWGTYADNAATKEEWAAELADVMLYCIYFANATDINLAQSLEQKIQKAEKKFPTEQFNPNSDSVGDYWAIKKKYRETKE